MDGNHHGKRRANPGLVQDAAGNNLTYRIIGAAMAVHNALGPGYKEEVYERALTAELRAREIGVERQFPVEVWNAENLVAVFYLDLYVERTVVVELKAFPHRLTDDEYGQVINYLQATKSQVGLLMNFGRRGLEWRRILLTREAGPVQRLGRDDVRKRGRFRAAPELPR